MSDILSKALAKAEKVQEINYLSDENVTFEKTIGGFLKIEHDGKVYPRVVCCACFAHSSPNEFISLREDSASGEEIGIIKNLNGLMPESKQIVTEMLQKRVFMPKIEKFNSVKTENGFAYFDCITNKGHIKFAISITSYDILRISDVRVILKDVDGNRFEIEDISELSVKEQRMIAEHV